MAKRSRSRDERKAMFSHIKPRKWEFGWAKKDKTFEVLDARGNPTGQKISEVIKDLKEYQSKFQALPNIGSKISSYAQSIRAAEEEYSKKKTEQLIREQKQLESQTSIKKENARQKFIKAQEKVVAIQSDIAKAEEKALKTEKGTPEYESAMSKVEKLSDEYSRAESQMDSAKLLFTSTMQKIKELYFDDGDEDKFIRDTATELRQNEQLLASTFEDQPARERILDNINALQAILAKRGKAIEKEKKEVNTDYRATVSKLDKLIKPKKVKDEIAGVQ